MPLWVSKRIRKLRKVLHRIGSHTDRAMVRVFKEVKALVLTTLARGKEMGPTLAT